MAQTDTLSGVSPRKPNAMPEAMRRMLLDAMRDRDKSETALHDAVRYALDTGGSVRTVAAVLGISTSTVQKWAKEGPTT